MIIPAKLSASGRAETYNLKSIVMHMGSVNSGHYFVYTLNAGQWLELNDEKISKVQADMPNFAVANKYPGLRHFLTPNNVWK